MTDLQKSMLAFEDFLNEPPQYEDKRMVRDYRHEAYRKWSELRDQITAALSPPEPTEGQITDAMVEEGAKVMASLCTAGIIEAPQLPAPCWNGSIRAILEAALRAMPLQQETGE